MFNEDCQPLIEQLADGVRQRRAAFKHRPGAAGQTKNACEPTGRHMNRIRIFVSSVQKESLREPEALRDDLRGDALGRGERIVRSDFEAAVLETDAFEATGSQLRAHLAQLVVEPLAPACEPGRPVCF